MSKDLLVGAVILLFLPLWQLACSHSTDASRVPRIRWLPSSSSVGITTGPVIGLLAWVVTVPASAIIAAGTMLLLRELSG
ncbi:hypothetical protein [Tranquillimonas alkanivorans]|uniref:hypothetical protein n=1 Tax=Tranquillimonas alkanivorans TaxID=441119 RepID=UPI0011604AAE|nr:hypothetical protein [Tranquillimonas alkanivorans]